MPPETSLDLDDHIPTRTMSGAAKARLTSGTKVRKYTSPAALQDLAPPGGSLYCNYNDLRFIGKYTTHKGVVRHHSKTFGVEWNRKFSGKEALTHTHDWLWQSYFEDMALLAVKSKSKKSRQLATKPVIVDAIWEEVEEAARLVGPPKKY